MTIVGDDLAYTVDLEHMTRHAGDHPTPRTLRCTQAYRRENSEWKVMLHKTRELLIKQRTMSVNALRSHLAEFFGLIAPKGIGRVSQLLELANADAALPEEVKERGGAAGSSPRGARPDQSTLRRRKSPRPALEAERAGSSISFPASACYGLSDRRQRP